MSLRFGFRRSVPLLLLASSLSAAPANDPTIRVEVDHARVVKMPQGAQTLVIGNPLIADVTLLKANELMVVTGKSFGSTNLIVLDRTGTQVGESFVTVVPTQDKLVVQRGVHRESLSCHPNCARAIDLGDDLEYMKSAIQAARSYEGGESAQK